MISVLLSYLWWWSQRWRSKTSRRISTAPRLCAASTAAPPSPARQSPPWTSWTSWAAPLSSGPAPSSGSFPSGIPARQRSLRRLSGRWRCRWWGRGSSRFASSWWCGVCQGDRRSVSAGLEDGELGWLMAVLLWRSREALWLLYEQRSCSFSTTPPSLTSHYRNPPPPSIYPPPPSLPLFVRCYSSS